MEDYLNEDESRLFDLIETKSWETLTAEERFFAEMQISKEEYTLQRQIMLESEDVYTVNTDPLPLAASIPPKRVIQRTIPLYQAIIAVAATVLVFVMIWPGESKTELAKQPVNLEVSPATPDIEKNYIIDTVIRYVTLPVVKERIIIDTIREFITFSKITEEPKLLEVASNIPMPQLSKESLNTKGASLKEDNTSQLLPRVVNTIY